MFIVFEGLDGSGSSTQVKLLAENLKKIGKDVVATKEPTNGPIGKLIRDYLQHKYETGGKALQLLFAADRSDHLYQKISPSMREGKIVISDRYFFSSIAFGARGNLEFSWLEGLYKNDFGIPDIVFLLKVSPKECIKRIESRGNEKELFEKEEVLECVWENYEKLAKKYDCIKIINGERSIKEIEVEVFEIVKKKLKIS